MIGKLGEASTINYIVDTAVSSRGSFGYRVVVEPDRYEFNVVAQNHTWLLVPKCPYLETIRGTCDASRGNEKAVLKAMIRSFVVIEDAGDAIVERVAGKIPEWIVNRRATPATRPNGPPPS